MNRKRVYQVTADGRRKGELFFNSKARRWQLQWAGARGRDTMPPDANLESITAWIKRTCLTSNVQIETGRT